MESARVVEDIGKLIGVVRGGQWAVGGKGMHTLLITPDADTVPASMLKSNQKYISLRGPENDRVRTIRIIVDVVASIATGPNDNSKLHSGGNGANTVAGEEIEKL